MAKRKKETEKEIEEHRQKKESQRQEHNKILKWIFGVLGIVILAALLVILISNYSENFNYNGVKFNVVKFCDSGPPCLVTYHTTLPVTLSDGKTADYNFYLRNDPRKLKVDFNGNLTFKPIMVFNTESDFVCNGNGAIAGANLVQLYNVVSTNVISDKNATCDSFGRYMLIDVKPGNQTRIEQVGPACYNIYIKDCEVLEGTEKFMIETFVRVNEALKNQSSK